METVLFRFPKIR